MSSSLSARMQEGCAHGRERAPKAVTRIAFVVSHPIQYYAPLHQRMAARPDLRVKVFFTWHAGANAVLDGGFRIPVAWDIPLTSGYEYMAVPNTARDPGTHHFAGLKNPTLVRDVLAWSPDVIHVSGWAWRSHLSALRAFSREGVPVLFRGDSHLLNENRRSLKWQLKRALLRRVFAWPNGFLFVGEANRRYYEAFGVSADRLHHCPHSIDVRRFSSDHERWEKEAAEWRTRLEIDQDRFVALFAGKFERKKRPVELMRALDAGCGDDVVLVMIGGGELEPEVQALAVANPERFRVLPFQNQSRMPAVYRLGDVFVLPSEHGETWGLAVNEAMACGRPVIVSDRVGCAEDVVAEACGRVFPFEDLSAAAALVDELAGNRGALPRMRKAAMERAAGFDIDRTANALLSAIGKLDVIR